ncbi:MAG: endonuclease domain-containing protein [Sphingomonadales bacterium]|nr:endonuclease domain-containing protein [Sphingomonadales bacterium]
MRVAITRRTSRHARQLRREMTDAERRIWYLLRDRRFEGWKFRRQVTVGPYVVDFLCHAARLVVEVDGGQHSEEVDARRTAFLASQGFRVIRFWNNDVLGNTDGVLQALEAALNHPHRCD